MMQEDYSIHFFSLRCNKTNKNRRKKKKKK